MALKDIFKMTKANRYTADGREELIKAQEAETDDRRYNIGEISEKTGLQKTANGWVKPKNGKQPGAKTGPGKSPDGVKSENKPAEKLPAKPTRGMSESYIRGTQLMKPAEDESQRGEQHWAGVLSGYDNTSVLEQRKQLQEKYDEFEEDIKDYDRRGLAPAVYAKRINQQNFIKGALKAIDDEMENRGMDPAPRTSVPDAAPRVLTGDTKIRVRK